MPGRILIVDDNVPTSDFIGVALEEEGFKTAVAATGAEALKQIDLFQPDLIVLDMRLPDIDGISLLTIYRTNGGKKPVVAFSASLEYEKLVPELDICHFFTKPFDLIEFLDCIKKHTT
jgi:DNA-binding response OmpR family regulator